jgi:hypothetical protein
MAPSTVSPRMSLSFDSRPYSLQAVKAQKVAPASSHIDAIRSRETKQYTIKSCGIAEGQLPHPCCFSAKQRSCPAAAVSPPLKVCLQTLEQAECVRASNCSRASVIRWGRQERAEALARMEKRSEGTSVRESELTPGVESVAKSDKQVKSCNICKYSKPLVDFEKMVTSADKRTEACRACLAVLKSMRPGSRTFPSWHLKLTPEEAWERAKSCSKCGLVKEFRDFARGAAYKDVIVYQCRSCASRNSGAQPARVPVDIPHQCSRCKEVKPATEYYRSKKSPTGLDSVCKPCKLENQRVWNVGLKASEKVPRHEKVCTACGQTKSVSEFYKRRNSNDGFSFHCKSCRSAYYKQSPRSKYMTETQARESRLLRASPKYSSADSETQLNRQAVSVKMG